MKVRVRVYDTVISEVRELTRSKRVMEVDYVKEDGMYKLKNCDFSFFEEDLIFLGSEEEPSNAI